MSAIIGIDQFFSITRSGAKYPLVISGSMVEESEVRDIRSVGNYKPTQLREGMLRASGNATVLVQSKKFLEHALRDGNGDLSELTIKGGDSNGGMEHTYCKVDSMSIECAQGEELRASMSWKGRSFAAISALTHSPDEDGVYEWYEGRITDNDFDAFEIVGFSFNINHNVDWISTINNTLTPKRRPTYVQEKSQVLSCTLRMLAREGTDLSASALALIGQVRIIFNNGTSTTTLTLTNLKRGTHEMPFTPEGLVEYGAAYMVQSWNVS